mmetsp:Transcript_28560/g.23639  ORF Transcript_28560/g.23639 Transcript_28560/m.23639 type:complete len:86 (-) Transcript_28560:270-527(-)
MYGIVYWSVLGVKVYFKKVSMAELRYVWKPRPSIKRVVPNLSYRNNQEGDTRFYTAAGIQRHFIIRLRSCCYCCYQHHLHWYYYR